MQLILNIGLARGDGFHVSVLEALYALRDARILVNTSRVFESDTEETLVVEADFTPYGDGTIAQTIDRAVTAVAGVLDQDCVAVYSPFHDQGRLIGPKAAAWGVFDPAQFILPNGTRLA